MFVDRYSIFDIIETSRPIEKNNSMVNVEFFQKIW